MCNMKLVLVLLALLASFPVQAEPPGSVVFFYLDQQDKLDGEIRSDFYYFYNKMKESFIKKGFEVLLVEKEPIKVKKLNFNIELSVKDIGIELGILFIKPTSSYEIFQGVGTDIDVLLSAEKYFNVKILEE